MTPDGKRNPVGLKVSDAKLAAIEEARGTVPRAVWLEGLIDAALGWNPAPAPAAVKRSRAKAPEAAGAPAVAPVPFKSPARSVAEAGEQLAEAVALNAPGRNRCPHKGTRITGGWCPECQVKVGAHGVLPEGWVKPEGWPRT